MTDKNNLPMEEIFSPSPTGKKEAIEEMNKSTGPAQQQDSGSLPKVKVSNFSKSNKSAKSRLKKPEKSDNFSPKEKKKSWYYSRYQSVVVQRNILLMFALLSMIAVTVSVVFVRTVTASKSLDPYVIEIEEKTGVPVVVEQLSKQYLTGNQMIIRYFLNQYIHASSGYDARLYRQSIDGVRLLSTPGVYVDFRRRIRPKDLGNGASIKVRIKSIQFPGPNTAQVRLLKVVSGDNSDRTINELINIEFRFAELALSAEERMINPLGFQVGRYLITEEIYEY